MKKLNLTGKLNLNKQTVAKLNDSQARAIMGGATELTTCVATAGTCPPRTYDCPTTARDC